jgi:hypothetical protein
MGELADDKPSSGLSSLDFVAGVVLKNCISFSVDAECCGSV